MSDSMTDARLSVLAVRISCSPIGSLLGGPIEKA